MIGRDWPQLPPLTADEHEEVVRLMRKFGDEHAARADAHRKRLAGLARHLGIEVREHRVTAQDAQKRLDRLAAQDDPESPVPISLVPWQEACEIVRVAFTEEYRRG